MTGADKMKLDGLSTVASSGAYADLSGRPTLGTLAALSYPSGATLFLRADGTWQVPAGGGGGAWGSITGTLSSQTDLNTALGLKAATSAISTVGFSGLYADLLSKPTLGTVAALSYPSGTTTFLRADGTWAAPTASAAWGSITGTLSAQTDLNTALTGKEAAITATTSADFWSGAKTFLNFASTVWATILTGLSTATSTAVVAADSILVAIGKLQAQITLRATLASPSFTGVPAAPTAAALTNTTQLATTAFVTTADNLKANIASPTFTGTVTIPFGAAIAGFAPLASPIFTGTPAAPTATAGTNTTQLATTAFVASAVTSAAGGLPSLIINGRFNINQRQKTGTVTLAAGVYGHDRFKAGASGCTYTFATSGGVTTLTISAGSLQQVVEASRVRTGTHMLEWSGTAQGKIGAGAYGATGLTGSLTGGANATVEFNTGTLTDVRLHLGSVSQPFIEIGDANELFACQRYCWRVSVDASISTVFQFSALYQSTTNGFVSGNYPQQLRTSPTLVVEGAASDYQIYDGIAATYAVLTALSLNAVSNAGFFLLSFSVASGGTAGRIGYFATNAQNTNSLRFEAEL